MQLSHSDSQGSLFAEESLPHGLLYRPDFIGPAEEAELLRHVAKLPFAAARYHEYTAQRRVVRYGERGDPGDGVETPLLPIPDFLAPLVRRVAQWRRVDEAAFVHALITEYSPGTPIGWHSDAPHFGMVAGVSLGGPARMQFRPYQAGGGIAPGRKRVVEINIAPRSIYVMQGEIRRSWQHHIPPVARLRYSITLRTLR